ncbi:MAG TPA: alpha/beta hydrolase [Polyangiales bacterium]|nr:alpha/beta hydrolase [Polyangiales bacterium]
MSIAYDRVGEGPALLLVHGIGDERSVWAELIGLLREQFSCIAMDLRGHGESDRHVDCEPLGLARDVHAVLEREDVRAPILLGHSLGGFVVTIAASERADVRAVLNVDQPLELSSLSAALRALEPALRARSVAEVLSEVLEQLGTGPLTSAQHAQLRASRNSMKREDLLGIWGPVIAQPRALNEAVVLATSRVRQPYLSLQCCAAPPGYDGWLRTHLPQSDAVDWLGVGHVPQLACTPRLAQLVRTWVARVLPHGPPGRG